MILLGPALIAAATLVVSGLAKLRRPETAVDAIQASGLPARPATARALGAFEVLLAVVVVSVGGTAYAVLGVWYLALAVVSWRLVHEGSVSCGCFGADSAPPDILHVVANVVLACSAIGAAATGVGTPSAQLDELGAAVVLLVAWVVLGTALIVAMYRLLPGISGRRSQPVRSVQRVVG